MKHHIEPAELLAFVGASGVGVQCKAVAERFGTSLDGALQRLKKLAKTGSIVRTHQDVSPLGRWCLPGQKQAALKDIEAQFVARKEARRIKAIPKARERWKLYQQRQESGEEAPARRVVSAAKAAPLAKLGPASVFEWGQR